MNEYVCYCGRSTQKMEHPEYKVSFYRCVAGHIKFPRESRLHLKTLMGGESMKTPIKCKCCKEIFYYKDELVFFLGGNTVEVSERYPDWDEAYCLECADDKGLI